MKNPLRAFGLLFFVGLFFTGTGQATGVQLEGTGQVGGGLFLPTGPDGNVADASPAIPLLAAVRFARHLGFEAEFLYVPIELKPTVLQTVSYRRSSQMAALAGFRLTSGSLLESRRPFVGYLSARAGFARIVTRTRAGDPSGSWIGQSVTELGNPTLTAYTLKYTQKGFALSPRAGLLLRTSPRSAIDLALYPLFIFNHGKVTTQVFLTLSLALSSWQEF